MGVELAGEVEFADAGGTDALAPELVSGKGERGCSELVPVDPKLEVMFKLLLGVTLGGMVTETFELVLGVTLGRITTVEFEDEIIGPLTVELVRGKGERGCSELVPVEPKLDVMFMLTLGVILGEAVTDAFEGGAIDPLTEELVSGKGERGSSELVPVEPKLEVMFKLALGVTLGGAVTEKFEDCTIDTLILAGVVELVIGNGERGCSELVPVEPRLEVIFELALGVMLGGTVTDEFKDCTTDALVLAGGVELVRGKGERGSSELVPVEPIEIGLVGTEDETFADGVMIPLLPVNEDVKVPPETVILPTLPVEETTMLGVGTGFVGPLMVTFAEPGGMIPDAPTEETVTVEPEVENITNPDEVVTLGGDPGVELGGGISPNDPVEVNTAVDPEVKTIPTPDETVTLGKDELAGGITPDKPVEEKTAVDPPVEKIAEPDETVTFGTDPVELAGGIAPDAPLEVKTAVDAPKEMISTPEDVITVMFRPGVSTGSATLDVLIFRPGIEEGGGMSPSDPVELAVAVLLATVKFALPTVTVSIKVTGPVGVGTGGITPFPPSLIVVAVENDTINTVEPTDIVSMRPTELVAGPGGTTPDRPVELIVYVDPELVTTISVTLLEEGGMTPLSPVEDAVKVEPDSENSAVPRVTVVVVVVLRTGTTGLGDGGNKPSPLVEVYVEVDPETTISIEP
jgi:hypothetical protein